MPADDRSGLWPLYGMFSGLMCAGGIFGTFASISVMKSMSIFYPLSHLPWVDDNALDYSKLATQFYMWASAYYITYAAEFLCSSGAKLIVLDRLANFGSRETGGVSNLFSGMGRFIFRTIILCNTLGICCNIVAAGFSINGSKLYEHAISINTSKTFKETFEITEKIFFKAQISASVQEFLEVMLLVLIVLLFVAVGLSSVRRVDFSLRASNVGVSGRRLRRQILVTVIFLFVTLLLRTG
jgi:hypothetical protein